MRSASTERIEISSQNHNYAVDPSTLPEGVEVTHINLNDGTCAGMVYPATGAMAIQNHNLDIFALLTAGRIEISSQNHNYAVDPSTLPEGVEVTHINLNDGTCAGMVYPAKRAMAIQYHPEASPGPHDSDVCFEQFMDMIRKEKQGKGGYTSSETAAQHVAAA